MKYFSHSPQGRYPEIDTARGIAILMMVTFHLLFDLNYFGVMDIEVSSGFWRIFAIICASLFVFLVGLSLSISKDRAIAKGISGQKLWKKYLMRGGGLLLMGLGITAITYLAIGDGFILFGILHLIGTSIMLSPLFFRFGKGNIYLGCSLFIFSILLAGITGPIWLAWLGFHPAHFYSIDYEPLIPWFGLVLVGLGAGSYLYPEGKPRWSADIRTGPISGFLALAGRHSLLIYLVHQPVIIGLMMATGLLDPGLLF
ncbi:hypothetical protein AZH53_05005 [Methanomicrobiaceae archaeon CYW5]|uniref:heparan-alpha-glucosaminide N-acetyltransferase n=1 Tax=Methanovulcanius yangii TaxID=1789227 RepID=UPI0029C9DEA8|nr:heparan-alpha-glucosaminide N-acetyltransferase [Methanovulcanius yangii]MBT8507775.1 hypothetical protein [Methanovulcanius yangii]